MKTYGLIGFPLGHSFSRKYFSEKFAKEGLSDVRYELFPLEQITELPALLAGRPDLCGLNVTIPYKSAVLPFLQEQSKEVMEIGACNCIRIRSGRLSGHNTDCAGFRISLEKQLEAKPEAALVLGTGGASKAVQYVLRQIGIPYQLVSRRPGEGILSYQQLEPEQVAASSLIVNTTPLGMYPDEKSCPPIPFEAIGKKHLLYDLVYNPPETEFMKRGRSRGARAINGYEMLVIQAEAAWNIWNSDPEPA